MARIRPILVVTDVPANSGHAPVVTQVASATELSMTWEIGKPESVSYRATGQDAVDHLTPGRAPTGTRIVGPSLDGGANQDTRMLSAGAQVTNDAVPSIGESGSGLGQVLATAGAGRYGVQQATLRDLLTAGTGQIKQQSRPPNTLLPHATLPVLAGIGRYAVGPQATTQAAALAFTYVVDPAVANLVLDIDINRDNRLRTLDTITMHMGSQVDVARAQYVIDSGDFGVVEGRRQARTVTIGHKGAASRLTYDGKTLTKVPQMVLQGTAGGAQTVDMCHSADFRGGDTSWGMPDGGAITGLRTTARTWTDTAGDLRIGMPIVGVYVDRDHGGVMAWIGDGELHPLSQAMGVTDLWYDEMLGESYAATDAGVYHLSGDLDVSRQENWIRVGSMALTVARLCKDRDILYALCAFKDGSAHILQYPAAAGSVDGHGYDGWSALITHGPVVDFAVSAGVLYWITGASGAGAVVNRQKLDGTGLEALPIPPVAAAGDVVATGLDPITDLDNGSEVIGIFVRTSQGSKGLYYIDGIIAGIRGAGYNALYFAGAGLVDALGAPVRVNRITGHSATIVAWDGGQRTVVHIWAATNRGVYASVLGVGSFAWRRTDGQGNLGDVEVQIVASAPPRKYLGQTQTRVWAATPSTIYESDDGTLHFVDMLARKLDAGPAFYALWKKAHGTYPTLADTTLDYPNAGGPFRVVRALDGFGQFEYRTVNPTSRAPGWAHKYHESPQVATGSLVSEIRGSQILIEAMCRFLGYTADAQLLIDVESYFTDDADPLRFLRPTHLVTLDAAIVLHVADPITLARYDNEAFFVLSHTIAVNGGGSGPGVARTRTRIATLLLDSRSDPERIIGDMVWTASRQTLYAKGR